MANDDDGSEHVRVVTDQGAIANSAIIVSNALTSPGTTLVIQGKEDGEPKSTSSARYNTILWVVGGITVFCAVTVMGFALWTSDPPSEMQKQAVEMFKDGFKLGFGAFVGLVGGKSV